MTALKIEGLRSIPLILDGARHGEFCVVGRLAHWSGADGNVEHEVTTYIFNPRMSYSCAV